jgi:hypothetical protein
MNSNRAINLLFAYFERPRRDYVRALKSIKATGGLSELEIRAIRDSAPEVHAESILRQLAAMK